jgi:hypothetical protein
MTIPINRQTLPLEDLEKTLAFQGLTRKQKLLIQSYIGNGGDKVLATQQAYDTSSPEIARKNSYIHFSNARVIAVLNLWLGKSEREILIDMVEEQLRRAPKGSTAGMKLTAQLAALRLGIPAEKEESDEPESKPESVSASVAVDSRIKVGDVITADGRKFRVTAVDASGRATEGEPLED